VPQCVVVLYFLHRDETNDSWLVTGTENVALAVGLGEASRLALQECGQVLLHMLTMKQRLIAALVDGFPKQVRTRRAHAGHARPLWVS
jgi:cysteine sulfinate desulfinase/cysteine desulfurase-like protein